MSKARKIVASRSSMRADAGRPRLTVRLSSADRAMAPHTAITLLLEHQVLAMHRGEQRDLALPLAVGRLLHQPADLTKDEPGDGGQRQLARLVELDPADVAELAGMADVAGRILG